MENTAPYPPKPPIPYIKEVIVVEGKADARAVKKAVNTDFILTNGFGITRQTFERIRSAQALKGVIVFTDPDHAGELIRKRINARITGCKNAFLSQKDASQNERIGIEYATPAAIRDALEKAKCHTAHPHYRYTTHHLLHHDLMGQPQSAANRAALGRILGIGYGNAKQFLHRLNHYDITLPQFMEALSSLRGT